jgi:hypothetical protein
MSQRVERFRREKFMNKSWLLAPLAALALVLGGCNDDDDPAKAAYRVLHASPDAPLVNVLVDGAAVLEDVDYKTGSGFTQVTRGSYDIAVEAIIPGGNAVVIDLPDTALAAGTDYSILAVGKVADATLEPLIIARDRERVSGGQVRAQVVHAAPDAPQVDVYVTEPGASLGSATPLGSFSFGQTLGPVDVPAGDYQVRVTLAGTTTVVFDSGTLALDGGSDLLIAAVANTGAGAAPISLVVLDGTGSAELRDVATPADVRVVHASPDAPAVDVVVNDDFPSPVISGLAYTQVAPAANAYLSVPPGSYNFKVTAAGNPGVIAIDFDADLAQGAEYSVLATGLLLGTPAIDELVLVDDNRSVATETRIRLVHASPAAGPVDIYVAAPGTDITQIEPAFSNVPFRADTGYVPLPEGSYEVTLTPAGNDAIVALQVTVPLVAAGVYTAVARDAPGGGGPVGLILLDDFVP